MTNFKNKTSYTVQNKKAEYMLFASQEVASLTVGEQCLELCNNYPYVLHVSDNCERVSSPLNCDKIKINFRK